MVFFWGRTELLKKNLSAYRLHVTTGYSGMSERQREQARRLSGGGVRAMDGGWVYIGMGALPCHLTRPNQHHSILPPVTQRPSSLNPGGEDKDKPPRRVLHYWCFSPGLAMEQLLELKARLRLLPMSSFSTLARSPD